MRTECVLPFAFLGGFSTERSLNGNTVGAKWLARLIFIRSPQVAAAQLSANACGDAIVRIPLVDYGQTRK